MKIRTDFVTNSSSSSFIAVKIRSKTIADYLEKRIDEIEENSDPFFDISIDGENVTIECDCELARFETPVELDHVICMLLKICRLETNDGKKEKDLTDSIEYLKWTSGISGLDGDDGRFDKDNYDSDVLEELLEEIAERNECSVEDVTDEMFEEYITDNCLDTTEEASFTFDKSTGEFSYYYFDGMHREEKRGDVSKKANSSNDNDDADLGDEDWKTCEGLTFVITGKVHDFKTHDDFVEYVEFNGGRVSGSVSSKTDFLVNNDIDSVSSKNKKAKELGVPIITEDEFIDKFGYWY